jgi:D-inositol-3-phosphate glycosyltransferase
LERPHALIDLAAELGIAERVSFLPPQPPQRLVQVYRAADLVAVPSYNESFGLVAIEAQASGTPVLAADVGGLGTAVRHDISGLLVPGHRTADWANALGLLLDDPDRLHRMSEQAVTHAANFSWAHTADGLLASYAAALAGFREERTGLGGRGLAHSVVREDAYDSDSADRTGPAGERTAALLGETSQARSRALWRRRMGVRR